MSETTPPIRPPYAQYGVRMIAAERQRQISQEGWTPEHDAEHDKGELLAAALVFGRVAMTTTNPDSMHAAAPMKDPPADWPWTDEWWNPAWGDPVRSLVKAGALIAAEIDRLWAGRAAGDVP